MSSNIFINGLTPLGGSLKESITTSLSTPTGSSGGGGGGSPPVATPSGTTRSLDSAAETNSISITAANFGTLDSQKFALSAWVKQEATDNGAAYLAVGPTASANSWFIGFAGATHPYPGALFGYFYNAAAALESNVLASTSTFTNSNGWNHFYMVIDTTQAVEADRVKIYYNGIEESVYKDGVGTSSANYPSLNANINTAYTEIRIGKFGDTSGVDGKWFDLAFYSSTLPAIGDVYVDTDPIDITGITGLHSLLNLNEGTTITDDSVLGSGKWVNNGLTASTNLPNS